MPLWVPSGGQRSSPLSTAPTSVGSTTIEGSRWQSRGPFSRTPTAAYREKWGRIRAILGHGLPDPCPFCALPCPNRKGKNRQDEWSLPLPTTGESAPREHHRPPLGSDPEKPISQAEPKPVETNHPGGDPGLTTPVAFLHLEPCMISFWGLPCWVLGLLPPHGRPRS